MEYVEVWQSDYQYDIAIKITKRSCDYPGGLQYVWCSYLLISDKLKSRLSENTNLIKSEMVNFLLENKEFLDDLEGWNGEVTFKSFEQDIETGQDKFSDGILITIEDKYGRHTRRIHKSRRHKTYEEALKQADLMRTRKILSLKKKIEILESLTFDKPENN